ncbi:hypothetical protein ALT_4753 [Aspergillus lentulus]|uniref:NmrA-like domain-containing protein n=1 Tax=Aspergillus lentulus TaxID=293939 RepID=A0AAN4TB05_ASPLE|nr:hypothetical protein ALT_4753 [Aspergillus lentulus]
MGSITEPDHLPSISYADLRHEDTGIRDRAAGAFTQALRDYGACRIRDHGIPQGRLDMCFEKCRQFFQRDPSEKVADCARSGVASRVRFVPYGSEKTRGEPHLEEVLQLRDGIYNMGGNWSLEAGELICALENLHSTCSVIHCTLLECLSSSLHLTRSLTSIHRKENSYFAPTYFAPCHHDENILRVPVHIDPTTMLFNFPDSHGGLKVADLRNRAGNLSAVEVQKTAMFIPTGCQPGEFVVLAGNLLRRLAGGIKHAVHYIERPLGSSGFHLNYWTVPDMDTPCDFGGKRETVEKYLMRNRIIVVLGSTGSQGKGVVSALLSDDSRELWNVRAVTRDVNSASAQRLLTDFQTPDHRLSLTSANVLDIESLQNAFSGAYGVFAVTSEASSGTIENEDDLKLELEGGKNIIAAAKSCGIQHFVLSSLPDMKRATSGRFDKLFHMDHKFVIGQWAKQNLSAVTCLLPGLFFTNLDRPQYCRREEVFALGIEKTKNKNYVVCSPKLRMDELASTFTRVTGQPAIYSPISMDEWADLSSREVGKGFKEDIRQMMEWISIAPEDKICYGALDPAEDSSWEDLHLRASSFEDWLRRSGWRGPPEGNRDMP